MPSVLVYTRTPTEPQLVFAEVARSGERGWSSRHRVPRVPLIVDGQVSLWNSGLLLYHLVLAGFDCSRDLWIRQYDYNIGIIVRKRSIPSLSFPVDLCMDTGDLQKLAKFFPEDLNMSKNSNGDILAYPAEAIPSLKIAVLIPARYNSSRFPGKALHKLHGVPMAQLGTPPMQKCGL